MRPSSRTISCFFRSTSAPTSIKSARSTKTSMPAKATLAESFGGATSGTQRSAAPPPWTRSTVPSVRATRPWPCRNGQRNRSASAAVRPAGCECRESPAAPPGTGQSGPRSPHAAAPRRPAARGDHDAFGRQALTPCPSARRGRVQAALTPGPSPEYGRGEITLRRGLGQQLPNLLGHEGNHRVQKPLVACRACGPTPAGPWAARPGR